jgi:hypothetical protein
VASKGGLDLDPGTQGPSANLPTAVFAVGNLAHSGEAAETAALSGPATAQHVIDYLGSGGHFILRVARPLENLGLLLRQGEAPGPAAQN